MRHYKPKEEEEEEEEVHVGYTMSKQSEEKEEEIRSLWRERRPGSEPAPPRRFERKPSNRGG